jgi:diguanylate cyclase (GGDEF)-like protein/putative nucleotidyltransferase with HDIG domain
MSAVPHELTLERPDVDRDDEGLSARAQVVLFSVLAAAAVTAVPALSRLRPDVDGWLTFALLATGAAVAQLFVVRTSRNQSYHTAMVFLVAAALMLPPELVALMGVVQHIPEWLKLRYPWYIQSFNIANYTLDALGAWATARLVAAYAPGVLGGQLAWALAGLAAALVFVALNHTLLALMLRVARGLSLRQTGLVSLDSLVTDLVLGGLGLVLASFWRTNPWLLPVAVAPLVLVHRSLAVPALKEEARVDAKTGLFNARHFAAELREELARSARLSRPLALIMCDLDLLREINNRYGHLAGDAVLEGIAEVFRRQLRPYDVPARFGGEEFAILLPETTLDQAVDIAERIRQAVAASSFEVATSGVPIRATVSLGVAAYPRDGSDANELVHQADLAVYRAKIQGRNRVLCASQELLLLAPAAEARPLRVVTDPPTAAPQAPSGIAVDEMPTVPQPRHAAVGPRFLAPSRWLAAFVVCVALGGAALGALALALNGFGSDLIGLLATLAFVAGAQALAVELEGGTISVSAVGALAGAAILGPRAALLLALAIAAVQWSSRRDAWYHVAFNVGALTFACLAASAPFWGGASRSLDHPLAVAGLGLAAGGAYFVVNTGLLAAAMALEGHQSPRKVWNERFAWLLPHYTAFGAVGAAIALAYDAIGLFALAVFALPLLLMRRTMAAYLEHQEESAQKLRSASETIRSQNVSLELANRLLRERSTAAMESLSATVDARDAYTAGHSRRVQQIAIAVGRELDLSPAELNVLSHAALFHDIGKLAVPDAVLLKPERLTDDEWELMRRHAEEGARIIDRLGFLQDAVPAIRHYHERFDGSGYPDGLARDDIPLGARVIHVADALDSMLTTRTYRAARPIEEALAELARGAGTQFCPRCVAALERALGVLGGEPEAPLLIASASA